VARRDQYPTHREPDRPPPLPFRAGEVSNGEFVPRPRTRRDRAIEATTLAHADEIARRLGMDRRRFLQTSGGMALMLSVVNLACASERGAPTASDPTTTAAPGGTFTVPPATEPEACDYALSGDEFIFDVHTHHVMPDGPWRQEAPGIESMIRDIIPSDCAEQEKFDCLDRESYVRDLLLGSDTTVSILSDVPNSGPADAPVPFDDNVGTHEFAKSLTNSGQPRALVQSVIAPNFSPLPAYFDEMRRHVETGTVTSFKVYTAWGPGGQGYALDDPTIGLPVVDHARDLGVDIICAHKGLPIQGFDLDNNNPRDVVAVAKQYPDMRFVIYHSAFERETNEGPYDPNRAATGTNSLLKAMDDYGLPPHSNVYCELGTTWREVMSNPTEAAHVLGKLLTRMGDDRVLWGTDAIWLGSPQPQIMAFRAFDISPHLQEQ
jgi:predicted TIM-barrel fold metal-dependent hydrolase